MNIIATAYITLADLNLWIKTGLNEELKLADIPSLISGRFPYIVLNWSTIKEKILSNSNNYQNPSRLREELQKISDIISVYKTDVEKRQPSTADLMSNYFSVFDSMLIADIPVSKIEQKQIDTEIQRIESFTKNDFIKMREKLRDGRDAISDSIGATDTSYNAIYQRSPLPSLLNRSISQTQASLSFHQGIITIEDILANENILKTQAFIDPFAFARANANNPDVDIRSYSSGTLTKLNYGESLKTLAYRTMGNEDRWVEIAIANGLKPPYVDEIGEKIYIIANAKKNTINISKIDPFGKTNKEKFYVNQIVILQSDIERTPDQRIIVNIKEIPISGELIIELNGEPDLEKYKISENANVRVFKPNTINSNFYILIPSETDAEFKNKEDPWFLKSKSEDEKKAGVDLLINSDSDLVFSPLGEVLLSYGVNNASQAIKILMNTFQGSLSNYEDYGIPIEIGENNTKIEQVKQKLSEDIAAQILNDNRFERLDYLSVEYIGSQSSANGYKIVLGVVMSGGGTTVIPISFSVNIS